MKQKKHNGLFLLTGIVLVLAVASVVGLYAAKKVKQATYQPQRIVTKITPTVTPNPTSLIDSIVGNATTIEDIDTSHWKTFTSSNSSFSYKYPSVGVKLSRDTLQPSYLQFSAEDPSEDESNNEVFNNPEIVIAFARGSAEYKAYTPAFDHIDKKI